MHTNTELEGETNRDHRRLKRLGRLWRHMETHTNIPITELKGETNRDWRRLK